MAPTAVAMTLLDMYEFLMPMWAEVVGMLFFCFGFAYMRHSGNRKFASNPKKLSYEFDNVLAGPQAQLHKTLEADVSIGQGASALKVWRGSNKRRATPVETLKVVAQAFLESEPQRLVPEIIEHIETHKALCNTRTITAVLDVIARSGHVVIMEEFAALVQKQQDLQVPPSSQTYEVLLGGHAAVGDESRVKALFAEARAMRLKITPRAYALVIKGFLKNHMVDATLHQILDMQTAGFFVPKLAVTQLFRAACEAGRGAEIFDHLFSKVQVPPDAVALIIEDAFKRNDLKFGLHVEDTARKAKVSLLLGSYESLLKLYASNANLRAPDLFDEMQKAGLRISEGLCVCLLARCADSKFLRFAEAIADFLRGRDGMTISVYSSLMKCYAYCGMYDKACDLYDQIRTAGLEPDSMMYGCLMKFAVECGRTDLSRELFDKAPALDIQNYVSLIRAAGREKDVDRAFSLLEKLESSGVNTDLAVYNCVLDACVSSGELQRARTLMEQMTRRFGSLDIIAFNTLLKGYCHLHDVAGAKDLLKEMTSRGFPPNDVSFNCVINASVSKGDFNEAWQTLELMEQSGVPVDHYTLSIIMKSLKRFKSMKHTYKALDLLDRTGIDVCSDEVLLNTVLDTCIRSGLTQRLETLLAAFSASTMKPCVHTYGLLIKACSRLKRMDSCQELWKTMVEHRGMEPNDIVLGCMLDALVCNNKVEEAVQLFKKWKKTVKPNTVMYSTLIKGFSNNRQPERAMEMFHEMKGLGLSMNNVVYNSLIDAQARVGAMDKVSELVKDMAAAGCEPDSISYSTIVKGYCINGELDKAIEVFRDLQSNSMADNCVIYNVVLDGCTKHNRMDLADAVIDDMEKYDVKPSNFTMCILVKMYGRRRQLDRAFDVIEVQEKRHGLRANAQVKTCLMCACLFNRDFERAAKVFDDLKASGQGADAKAYGVYISGVVRHGHAHLAEAVELVKEAYGLNASGDAVPSAPGVETRALEQLLSALQSAKLMESVGRPLMEQLRAARVPMIGHLLSSFLGGRHEHTAEGKGVAPWRR